ncbi:hypothetical protein F5Y17DRAFT_457215 [Xylariaceae sp. FL0594]|nr:hypothetical protein F5Y17DRAFT_457215 [Xylariaceae sp. FL0594]
MALAPIAGNIINFGSDLFQPRDFAVEARADAPANDNTTIINVFLSNPDPKYEFVASVVEACADKTVLAVQCTKGPTDSTDSFDQLAAAGCGRGAPAVTITEAPDHFHLSTAIETMGAKATFVEDCKLDGSNALCTLSYSVSISEQTTATSTTATLPSGTDYRHEVTVTAGAEKLGKATHKCDSAASGISARAVALWGLLASFGVVLAL